VPAARSRTGRRRFRHGAWKQFDAAGLLITVSMRNTGPALSGVFSQSCLTRCLILELPTATPATSESKRRIAVKSIGGGDSLRLGSAGDCGAAESRRLRW